MAEAIVSLAVEGITDLLIHKTKFLCDVSGEVERLRDELKRMQCFLKDAELRQEQDERVRNWVAEIRDTAYDVEDVVEMYVFKVALLAHGKGFHGFCNRFTSIFIKPFHLRKIGKQIKAIHSKIGDISSSLQTYGIRFDGDRRGGYSFESGMQRNMRRSFPHVEEEDVINLEDCTKDVLSQLMAEQTRFRIVSIVGMGGIGKTTLAKQQYSVRDVLSSLLAKVESSSFDKMSEEQLVERLFNVLKRRRYLVVLDDIWRKETWDNLRSAFPNGKPGSKILLTTRNKEVASYADPWSSQIEPPFLTMEEGWDLLCKKAFPRDIVGEHTCQPEFQNLGRKMVKKCGGLPLAIVLLGGLLATKKSLNDWKVVLKNINLHFNKYRQQDQHYGGVHGILALSYNDLPFHLKPCFLYLGHFPEDSEISKKELIWLWMAEGFITSQRGEREEMMEDLAEEYLEELINRCLVQVGKMDHTGNGVKTCRIHDLLRDLCVSKAEQENFLDFIHLPMNENSNSLSLAKTTPNARRIAVHPGECHDRLKLYFARDDERYGCSGCNIVIDAPGLMTFKYRGYAPKVCSSYDLASIEDVYFDIYTTYISGYNDDEKIFDTDFDIYHVLRLINTLREFRRAKTLTLSLETVEALAMFPSVLDENRLPLSDLKYLKIKLKEQYRWPRHSKVEIPSCVLNFFLNSFTTLKLFVSRYGQESSSKLRMQDSESWDLHLQILLEIVKPH
ncbi:Disease resistance protein [Corchorus olitorius]|uniref:Disease resistance protein n=1 Tax=Corchorus olitorius TaxID=93759 RepID=A0A1R3J5F1_9ROSI|nr:Disease resistance protein [Corchorus olitorius]